MHLEFMLYTQTMESMHYIHFQMLIGKFQFFYKIFRV